MYTSEPTSLQHIFQAMMVKSPYQEKFIQASIINAFNNVMPTVVQKKVRRFFVKKKKLFIEIDSSPLKHELQLGKQKIIQLLCAHDPICIVDDIVFL